MQKSASEFRKRLKLCSDSGKNLLPDSLNQKICFLHSGIFAERDPETAINDFGGHIHFCENPTPVPFGTGRTGGYTYPFVLENINGILGGNTGNADIENMGGFVSTVYDNAWK